MKRISSACELLIFAPSVRTPLFWVWDGISAVIEKFIAAEQADFLWESRFAERDRGEFESFDGDEDSCRRVAVMGYFRGQYYVAICVTDAEKQVAALIKSRRFESFLSAEIAFLATY